MLEKNAVITPFRANQTKQKKSKSRSPFPQNELAVGFRIRTSISKDHKTTLLSFMVVFWLFSEEQ